VAYVAIYVCIYVLIARTSNKYGEVVKENILSPLVTIFGSRPCRWMCLEEIYDLRVLYVKATFGVKL